MESAPGRCPWGVQAGLGRARGRSRCLSPSHRQLSTGVPFTDAPNRDERPGFCTLALTVLRVLTLSGRRHDLGQGSFLWPRVSPRGESGQQPSALWGLGAALQDP